MSSSFEERKRAAEAKFAHDEEMKFKAQARRDKLLGLWAAELMGLSGQEAEAYARDLVTADLAQPGDEDVFIKLRADFNEKGVNISDEEIRAKMDELLVVAYEELSNA